MDKTLSRSRQNVRADTEIGAATKHDGGVPALERQKKMTFGDKRAAQLTDPWGTACRECNARSVLSECRAAYAMSPCLFLSYHRW